MPLALSKNAAPAMLISDNKPREMDLREVARRRELAICPTDDDAITPEKKQPDKQSFDYIWRTGLAGGLAGSAVRCFLLCGCFSGY
jgi:solute carrier family 25 protein 16